jgi:hypothetical protein
MLHGVCDVNTYVYFLGDENIDWFSSSCPLKRKLLTVTSACNLVQDFNQPTSIFSNTTVLLHLQHNWWLTKYFFAPLYLDSVSCCGLVHAVTVSLYLDGLL